MQPLYLSKTDSLIYLAVRALSGFPVSMPVIPEPQPPFNSSSTDLAYQLLQKIKNGGAGGGGNAALTREINVFGTSIGWAGQGSKFPVGMTFTDWVESVSTHDIPPTYVQPSGLIMLSGSATEVEAGSNISAILTPNFYQNHAGAMSSYALSRNGVVIHSAYNQFTDNRMIGDEILLYQAAFGYGTGPVLNASPSGTPSPGGQIIAGSVNSNPIAIFGLRKAFFGHSNAIATSANIRGMQGAVLNPQAGTEMIINIPAGATSVEFSYRDNLRDVSSVKYVELSNAEVKGNFVKTANSVADASGANPLGYKTFKYTPAAPFSAAVTYKVTI